MDPIRETVAPPSTPPGSMIRRTLHALFVERRLPTKLSNWLHRSAIAAGLPNKTIRLDGLVFIVRRLGPEEFFAQEIVVDRGYTPPGYELHPDDVVVDVGANVGVFAVFAANQTTGGRVIAVEPSAANVALLRKNVQRNRCQNVTVRHAAIWNQPGRATLKLSQAGSGCHSLFGEHTMGTAGEEEVEVVSLPGLFSEQNIETCDFLKLDCEGAEFDILLNLEPEWFRRIRRVVIEYHGHSEQTKRAQAEELIACLERNKFQIDRYTDAVGTPRGMIFARKLARPTDPG